ncbi:ornithine cyclodeaminase family protein [Virgibacillus sp. 179-BFC.A HS]|uniref:Ornithine cyclodeaminase family protein n=1 Tax=Tigheibacillus jepli TaxID=3035914 RepID=A0ABU5CFY7_9BACI|nr:ornithine cyclodeaminase family protein [Virgibacillus sp. 179-BFC.A HS]MDY0404921.1 ornithine cyclodeaminase family protein [Virgibacillus sp. 179-BFC.A HS]
MLVLSEKIIQENYQMADAIRDLKEGFRSKADGTIQNPHRTVIEFPDHQASILYMPSADMKREIASIKIVSIFPENPTVGKATTQGMLLLTDAANGDHLCMMSASYLTRLRTGALTGIATDKLAREDSKTLGVIGTGAMAFEQTLGVLEVRAIETIYLFNRTEEKAHQFKQKLHNFGVKQEIHVLTSANDILDKADVICCSTRSYTPIFDGYLLQDGTHINGVGSYLPHMREVDLTTVQKASKIVVDDLPAVKDEAGELIHADSTGKWCFSDIHAELGDISNLDHLVRESNEEITFFKSVGAAYIDLFVAKGIYEQAKARGVGDDVAF